MLVKELVKAGVCRNEAEVINRAVLAFFVAIVPQEPARQRIVREVSDTYHPEDPD